MTNEVARNGLIFFPEFSKVNFSVRTLYVYGLPV